MKHSLIHPVVYLFILMLSTFLLTVLCILIDINLAYPDLKVVGLSIKQLPLTVSKIFPAACLISLILLFFRMVKKPGSRLLSFLLVFVIASGSLIAGFVTLNLFTEPSSVKKEVPIEYLLPTKKIITNNSETLYLEQMSKSTLEEIIRVLPQAPEKEKFLYYPKGLVQKQNDKLVLNLKTEDNRPQTLTLNATPPHAALQQAHWSVELFIKDFVLVTDELNNFFMNYKNTFYFLCFALVFAIMSCQVFLRITRWPLFNLLLLIILSRGFLTFYNLMRFEIIIKLLKLGSDSFFIRLLPSLCLVGLGILFFIIDILFIPANLRQKEIENA